MKMTHIGTFFGDARTGGRTQRLYLRETTNYWITKYGDKYSKDTGHKAGSDRWPLWHLDLQTVKELTTPVEVEVSR
ncbi:MAG: hypothetical protein MUP27_09175 [Desulfobacterales bacterium]|nr:hypothetical protein [Desulfobacterales bacterium]